MMHRSEGFTLLEVIAAVVVVGIVFGTLAMILGNGLRFTEAVSGRVLVDREVARAWNAVVHGQKPGQGLMQAERASVEPDAAGNSVLEYTLPDGKAITLSVQGDRLVREADGQLYPVLNKVLRFSAQVDGGLVSLRLTVQGQDAPEDAYSTAVYLRNYRAD